MTSGTWLVPTLGATVLTAIPLYARFVRGRSYATFGFVILLLSLPGLVIAHGRLQDTLPAAARTPLDILFAYAIAAAGAHLAALVRPRLRRPAFRLLVSVPGMTTIAAGALAGAWLVALLPLRSLAAAFDLDGTLAALAWLDLVPFGIAAASLATSLRTVDETVRVPLAPDAPPAAEPTLQRRKVARVRGRRAHAAAPAPPARALRIVQIADPHLGPWQPVARLERRVAALVARNPDLVLLTGDFLTMEGSGTPGALAAALRPLSSLAGRCFAIFGNHDHESPEEVRQALRENGISLLVDREVTLSTPVGPVQLLGADYVGRGRRRHLEELLARHPRLPGHVRILLLHDPSAFRHVPHGEADLTLSGHTHGGQVGLLSLGIDWTVLRRTNFPDHGLFARGRDLLYVHRGSGFYGFPLRIGVPGEHSLLELVREPEHGGTAPA